MADNRVNFVYKLEGDIAELDVFKLAPTLLALGELIQEANEQLNPNGRKIACNVRPFREGSFIVNLTVFPDTHLQQLMDWFSSQPVEQVKNILEWVGLIGTGPGGIIGVVQLIKWLRGRPKTIEEIAPGEVRYIAGDDRSITVRGPVHQLAANSSITNHIYTIYAGPLEQEISIRDVKTYLENDEPNASFVSRDELPSLKDFIGPSNIPTYPAETIQEHIHHGVFLNPKRGSFDGDPKDWSFFRGDDIVVATIKDKDFLYKYKKGEYRLNHTDLLTVDLLERQRIMGTKVLKPIYEIVRVTNYVKGPEQERINGA